MTKCPLSIVSAQNITTRTKNEAAVDESVSPRLSELRERLYRWAFTLTQSHAAADDLVQATVERALVARQRFQTGSNLSAWLRSIMRNLFVDGVRRDRRAMPLQDEPVWEPPSLGDLEAADFLGLDDVTRAMKTLAANDREIVRLAYLEHCSYEEISRRLNIVTSTTGTRLFRARAKLRKALDGVYQRRRAAFEQDIAQGGDGKRW